MSLSASELGLKYSGGFFDNLSPAQYAEIERIGLIRSYSKDEIIFYEGDDSSYFHFLLSGEAKIFKSPENSEIVEIYRFRSPAIIAEMPTLKSIPYPASCEAIDSVKILKIQREPFLELIKNDPSFTIALLSSLSNKIGVMDAMLKRHSAPSVMAKVSQLLLDDIDSFSSLKGVEIAKLLAITPESLSRTLSKLKKEHIISSRDGKITITNREYLITHSGK